MAASRTGRRSPEGPAGSLHHLFLLAPNRSGRGQKHCLTACQDMQVGTRAGRSTRRVGDLGETHSSSGNGGTLCSSQPQGSKNPKDPRGLLLPVPWYRAQGCPQRPLPTAGGRVSPALLDGLSGRMNSITFAPPNCVWERACAERGADFPEPSPGKRLCLPCCVYQRQAARDLGSGWWRGGQRPGSGGPQNMAQCLNRLRAS